METRRFQVGYAAQRRSFPLGPYYARLKLYRAIRANWDRSKPLRWRRFHQESHEARGPWRCAVAVVKAAKKRNVTTTYSINVGLHFYTLVADVPAFPYTPPEVKTDALERLWQELWLVFPKVRNMGVYNPRYVKGTTCWSEHAWAGAWDFGWSYDLGEDAGKTYVGIAASYLHVNAERFGLRQVVWQDKQFYGSGPWVPYGGVPHVAHIHAATTDHDCEKPPWI